MPYATSTRTGASFNAGFDRGGRVLVDPDQAAKVADMFIKVYKHDASVAREGIVNGLESVMDAHDRYGKPKQKVVVTLPDSTLVTSTGEPGSNELTITDYGLGLSIEDFENTVMWFGRSTKDGNDRQGRKYVGGKGIGAKSGAYISSPFFYEIAKDGVKNRVEVYTDAAGMGWNLLSTDEDYDGPDQVKMIVPFPADNRRMSNFVDEMRILLQFFSKDDVQCDQIDTLGAIADKKSYGNVTFGERRRGYTRYLEEPVIPTVKGAPYSYSYTFHEDYRYANDFSDAKDNTPLHFMSMIVWDALRNGNVSAVVELDHDDVQIPADRESLSKMTRTSNKISDSLRNAFRLVMDDMTATLTERLPDIAADTDLALLHPADIPSVVDTIGDILEETFGMKWLSYNYSIHVVDLETVEMTKVYSSDALAPVPTDEVHRASLRKTPFRDDLKAYRTFVDSDHDSVEEVFDRHDGVKFYAYRNQYANVYTSFRIGSYSARTASVSLDSYLDRSADERLVEAGAKFQEDRKLVNAVHRRANQNGTAPGSTGGRPHAVRRIVDGEVQVTMMNLKEVRAMAAELPEDSVCVVASRGDSPNHEFCLKQALRGFDAAVTVHFRSSNPSPLNSPATVVHFGGLLRVLAKKLTGREFSRDDIEHVLLEQTFSHDSALLTYHRAYHETLAYLMLLKLGVRTSKVMTAAGAHEWIGSNRISVDPILLGHLSGLSNGALPRYNESSTVDFTVKIRKDEISMEKLTSISAAALAFEAAANN